MTAPSDAIELQDATSEVDREDDPAAGGEEWFSPGELQRDSEIELDAKSEAPTLLSVPSAMSCLEAWSTEALSLDPQLVPLPIYPRSVVWVDADPPAMAVDWIESVVDTFVSRPGARVLYVVGEDPTAVEARAWARCVGLPRGSQRGSAAAEALRDEGWRQATARRREAIRYFAADALLEQNDRVVEVAEALRSWRRGSDDDRGSSLVVVQQAAMTLRDAGRDRLERLAREQDVALVVTGQSTGADASCDTILKLQGGTGEGGRIKWTAPVAGEYGGSDLRWQPRVGRLSLDLKG